MPARSRRLGIHLPLGHGMVRAAERARTIDATALQIFSDNPTAWRRRPELPAELPAFRNRLRELDVTPLAIHAAYLVNLAGPDDVLHERSIEVAAHELRIAVAYGARFVNVHVGSHLGTGTAAGIARVADGVARALATSIDGATASNGSEGLTGVPPMLVLENSAGGGFGLGTTIEELAAILDAVAARGAAERLAFCADTAHLWGAGYAIDDPEAVDRFVDAFDRRIGLDRLAMIHLNDSKADLGSHADRHAHVGAGRIGPVGLGAFLRHPALAHVAYYLETPGMDEGWDAVNMARARALARGRRRLPALPAAAFEVRGSRARTGSGTRTDPRERASA